jgi:hypothetical protein
VPVVALRDFINALAAVLEKRRTGLFNLYHPRLVTLRDLIAAVRMASGSRALLLPVPASVLIAAGRLAGSAGVALPFDAENFLALRANRKIADASDLPQFIAGPAALAEMVAAATAELSGQGGA